MFKGQDAQELVHVKIKFKKRTNSFEKEDIESTVINLSEFPEDQNYLRQLIIMIVKP